MANESLRREWLVVEQHIKPAMHLCGSDLPKTVKGDVQHFLDHNELGLAFETPIFASKEMGFSINESAGEILDQVAILTELQTGGWRANETYLSRM